MTVLECGDATEVESVLDLMQDINGPVYVRMLRGEIPRLFDSPMIFGKARVLTEGKDIVDPVKRHHDRRGDAGSAGAPEEGPLDSAHAYFDVEAL